MHPDLLALARSQGGPFTAAQARAAGYDAAEVTRLVGAGEWQRVRRGVYAETALTVGATPDDLHLLALRGLLLAARHPLVASHVTAAVVHGLPLLQPDLSRVHVTRRDLRGSRTEAGVVHHGAALPPGHVVSVRRLAVVAPARAAVDVARTSSYAAAVAACDSALRAGVTRDELRDVLLACASWPGARGASRAVAFADGLAANPGESLARVRLAELGLPPPLLQVELRDATGRIGIVDFLWAEHGVVGEFDGKVKYDGTYGDGRQVLYDEKRREDRLRALGFVVVRFGWAELHAPRSLEQLVRTAFARSAAGRSQRPA